MAKAWCTGANDVLTWFKNTAGDNPYYSVWMGRQLLFSWNHEDTSNGEKLLDENLDAFEKNQVTDVFTIKLHPKIDSSGYISDKTPIYASLNFQPCSAGGGQVSGSSNQEMVFPNNPGMQRMFEKLTSIESRLAAVEAEDEEPALTGILASPWLQLLEHPEISKIVSPILAGMARQAFPGIEIPQQVAAGIAGLPDLEQEQKISDALEILKKHDPQLGDDLTILASVAENKPKEFAQFLMILRTNG